MTAEQTVTSHSKEGAEITDKNKGKAYVNIEEKGEKGDYSDLIDPLDYLILQTLPDEGTMFGGVYPEGKTAGNIITEKFQGVLKVTQVSSRLSTLKRLGLAIQVKSLSGGNQSTWQRTKKGKELVTEWQQRQPAPKGK